MTPPKWLEERIPRGEVSPELLNKSREECYSALATFHTYVRYVFVVLISWALVGILSLLARDIPEFLFPLVLAMSGIIIAGMGIVTRVLIKVIRLYYKVYLWALIFAVRLHLRAGLALSHPWLRRTIDQTIELNGGSEEQFIEKRVNTKRDAFYWYRAIISATGLISLSIGAVFLVLSFLLTYFA